MSFRSRNIQHLWSYAAIIGIVLLLDVVAHVCVLRWDLTDDQRYSLSPATKELLNGLQEPLTIRLYLEGELNAGFRRLQAATIDLCEEMNVYADIEMSHAGSQDAEQAGLAPILIHERTQSGRTAQTQVYPYMQLVYGGRSTVVTLLRNQRGLSGEENLNQSIENLEYAVTEAVLTLVQIETPKIAFLEGHGELPEENVYDISATLSRYFQIDRGVLGNDPTILDDYRVVIVADPQLPFSESDKYILDQYVRRGGSILWIVNGVRFSSEVLTNQGFTPVIPLDLNLTDMFFRYGIRIAPALVQDVQCLPIPVDVSSDPATPNYQPMPWYYAPLLLTSQHSPITRNVAQISSSFVSPIEIVGEEDGLQKSILLASSSASRVIGTPAEVDLGDMNPDFQQFHYHFIPVGVSVEGVFESVFAHRMVPEGINTTLVRPLEQPTSSKQIWIASGSVIRNEWQQGQPLPVGYDRYSQMQFGNRDLLTNAVLYLADNKGLIALRERVVALRLLNDKRAHDERLKIQIISTTTPILVLAILGIVWILVRRYRNIKQKK